MRSISRVLFEVFSPSGRGRGTGLDHRVPVVGRRGGGRLNGSGGFCSGTRPCGSGAVVGGRGVYGDGGIASSRAVDGAGVGDGAAAPVVVSVGYDYGVSGTVRSVAVGPPEQSQHNIRCGHGERGRIVVVVVAGTSACVGGVTSSTRTREESHRWPDVL